MNEHQYKLVLEYSKSVCIHNQELDPADLVQEAYLKLYELPFSLQEYKKAIKELRKINGKCYLRRDNANTKRRHTAEDNYKWFKTYIRKHRDLWNTYNRKRFERDKELLTDAFIRKCLRYKYTTEYLLANKSLIERHRNKLIEKRKRAKQK